MEKIISGIVALMPIIGILVAAIKQVAYAFEPNIIIILQTYEKRWRKVVGTFALFGILNCTLEVITAWDFYLIGINNSLFSGIAEFVLIVATIFYAVSVLVWHWIKTKSIKKMFLVLFVIAGSFILITSSIIIGINISDNYIKTLISCFAVALLVSLGYVYVIFTQLDYFKEPIAEFLRDTDKLFLFGLVSEGKILCATTDSIDVSNGGSYYILPIEEIEKVKIYPYSKGTNTVKNNEHEEQDDEE